MGTHKVVKSSFFTKKTKIPHSLPDIDSDMSVEGKKLVVKHLQDKYGYENVCYIITYSEMKIKSSLKDFGKINGINDQDINVLTGMLPKKQSAEIKTKQELIEYAQKKPLVKQFIRNNSSLIDDVDTLLGAYRQTSLHAGGIILVPNEDEKGHKTTIHDYFPAMKGNHNGEEILISMFNKKALESLAFLKNDLLIVIALNQIEKTISVIKEQYGEDVDINKIPLDDPSVYREFAAGNSDYCFQFNSSGMQSLLRKMIPNKIEDLAVANALYRPGPMAANAHIDYCLYKSGDKIPEYIPGTQNVLKDTFSLMVFQEQIIQIVQDLASFNQNEADDVRSATSKKDEEKMKEQREKFLVGATKNGHDRATMEKLWSDIEAFAAYSFNKSHAVGYSILGYIDQWLKSKYAPAFWTPKLDSEKEKQLIIWAIKKDGKIKVKPCDINKSQDTFYTDYQEEVIYASLESVHSVAAAAIETIMKIREGGEIYSFDEFLLKVKQAEEERKRRLKEQGKNYTRSIDKAVITNLVLCGAFDAVENITSPMGRIDLLQSYNEKTGIGVKQEFLDIEHEYQVSLWQLKFSGIADVDYSMVFPKRRFYEKVDESLEGESVSVAGTIENIDLKRTKKSNIILVTLYTNLSAITVFIWDKDLKLHPQIKENKGQPALFTGEVKMDPFSETYRVYSDENTKILFG